MISYLICHRDLSLAHGEHIASLGTVMTSNLSTTSMAVLTAVNTAREDSRTELSLVSEDMKRRIGALETLMLAQHERTRDHFVSQQLPRVSGNCLLGTPAVLREACDIVNAPSANTPGTIFRY